MKKILFALILLGLILVERLIFDLGPNVELITASSFIAAAYLGYPFYLLVPFLGMVFSDTLLGNTNIIYFTWSAYLVSGLLAYSFNRQAKRTSKRFLFTLPFAFTSSLFFFLWTNFGVWLQGWYPQNLSGLITCYTMAIPFLKYNLFGNLLLVPASVVAVEAVKALAKTRHFSIQEVQTQVGRKM